MDKTQSENRKKPELVKPLEVIAGEGSSGQKKYVSRGAPNQTDQYLASSSYFSHFGEKSPFPDADDYNCI